jgi:hypothetical protein
MTSRVGSRTTSHRPSACGFASEVRSTGIPVDAALVAVVRIAAEPIVIAVSRMRIGLERRVEPIRRRRERSLRGRRGGGMRLVAAVAMMTQRGALGRPGRGHGKDGAHRHHQTSIAPHKALLSPRHKIGAPTVLNPGVAQDNVDGLGMDRGKGHLGGT